MEQKNRSVDLRVRLYKGIIGVFPVIGPLAAEVVDTLIPNQRLDRIEDFLQKLDEKINELELSSIESSFRAPEFIDLFEDGMYQAARSLSDKKKEYIACILKNSLTITQNSIL